MEAPLRTEAEASGAFAAFTATTMPRTESAEEDSRIVWLTSERAPKKRSRTT